MRVVHVQPTVSHRGEGDALALGRKVRSAEAAGDKPGSTTLPGVDGAGLALEASGSTDEVGEALGAEDADADGVGLEDRTTDGKLPGDGSTPPTTRTTPSNRKSLLAASTWCTSQAMTFVPSTRRGFAPPTAK
jgi:hypothetical protein